MLIYRTNGNSYEPEITYVRGEPHYGGSNVGWMQSQFRHMKDDLDTIATKTIANTVRFLNKLCYQSSVYTPTLKSIALFGDVEDILSERRRCKAILPTKNPVMFGAMVYLETEKFLGGVDAEIVYTKPSEFVGLEFGTKRVLNKSKLNVNYDHPYATRYADRYENVMREIEDVSYAIIDYLEWVSDEDLKQSSKELNEIVRNILVSYHKAIKENVLVGVTRPVIEDVWLNHRSDASEKLASMLIKLYDYAENKGLEYDEEYPNFNANLAEEAMQDELNRFDSNLDYTLYSSAFDEIKGEEIYTSSGRAYNLSYVIPTVVYAQTLLGDLKKFLESLEDDLLLFSHYECKRVMETQFVG